MCKKIEAGHSIGELARFTAISRQTASKWWNRYQTDGESGLGDRRSRPHSCPNRLSQGRERRIIGLSGEPPLGHRTHWRASRFEPVDGVAGPGPLWHLSAW